jgi:flap endonuclease-1
MRAEAERKWAAALEKGEMEEARKFAQRSAKLNEQMILQAKELLDCMGIPWIQAPGEGEAQAAFLVQRGDAWGAASQDFDSLLFGAPLLIRNLAITGRRKLPSKDVYMEVSPELIELQAVLKELGITREQLVDIGILIGTDYNRGVKGIGPKKALEFVKQYRSVEEIQAKLGKDKFEVDPLDVEQIFLKPNVTSDYKIKWEEPDPERIKHFLCDEYDFSESRVQSGIDRLTRGQEEKKQASLERWVG